MFLTNPEIRLEHSGQEMNDFINNAGRLDKSQVSDYKMQGTFKGASGETHVQVSKEGSKVTLVVAIVVGLILLLVFLSRH